jgi:hypothetical protein
MTSPALTPPSSRELKAAYHRFMKEQDPALKEEAGRDLIRAIFGNDALAEDTPFLIFRAAPAL